MDASVAQFPFEMGKVAVESAVKVMRGEKLPPDSAGWFLLEDAS